MRKAILLYNPFSGKHRDRRTSDVEAAATVLRKSGIEVSSAATRGGPNTAEQVREAISSGCDTVFACGGDGTVHDVLQGLVGTEAALGIIPLGTANALAHDLGVPLSPSKAAQSALQSHRKRIAVGVIEFKNFAGNSAVRYFTIAAGIGLDARLFYDLNASVKRRLGMGAYYAMAWRLWLSTKMDYFIATSDHFSEQYMLTQLLAVRIQNFGGVLRELAPDASLDRNDLRLVLCRTRSRMFYLLYVIRGLLGRKWHIPGIEWINSPEVSCDYPTADVSSLNKVYVEADGELLGNLPVKVTMAPDALTLLVPSK